MANAPNTSESLEVNSVLVATDLTEATDGALEHGIAIARHYRATLYVVHVVSPVGFNLAGPDAIELAANASERDIKELVYALVISGKLNGVEVQPIVLMGNIDEQIESFAHAHRVDLIVVGSHGRQGFARLFWGAIAQLISTCCCCPVLTVGPRSSGPWLGNPVDSGKPLLFATAFDKASAKALTYAVSLANDFERPLYVLYVMAPHRAHLLNDGRAPRNENEASALEHLYALIPPDEDRKSAATFLVESCAPSVGILRVAKRIHAVTIIMGAHRDSSSHLATRLPWHITNHVNREDLCPVLTVRG